MRLGRVMSNGVLAAPAGAQEAFYGKDVIVADREMVESAAEDILRGADTVDVAFLVVGDPFGCVANYNDCGVKFSLLRRR